MKYKTIEPCKTKKGFQAIPEMPKSIELEKIAMAIPNYLEEFKLIRITKVVALFKDEKRGYRLSLYPSGKAFIFDIADRKEAEEIFRKLSLCISKQEKGV